MEDVLDVLDLYAQPDDPQRPVVCLDEKPVVLHAAARPSLPATPGHVERRDDEYVRQGTAAVFMLVEPRGGWRHDAPSERRTAQDDAAQLRFLADEVYPDAQVIRLVQDNPHHPWPRRPLCDLRARGGPTSAPALRVPPHPQARQLAEHGRDRDQHPDPWLPEPPLPRRRDAVPAQRCPGERAQRRPAHDHVAVYNG